MANIKSQLKRIKTAAKRTERNKDTKSAVKTFIRRFNESLAAGDREAAEAHMRKAARELDEAAQKGVIHKNNAANRKSAMMLKFNKPVVAEEPAKKTVKKAKTKAKAK